MIKIVVCDDEEVARQIVVDMCNKLIPELTNEAYSVQQFDNPTDMLAVIEDGESFDLILCDIYMPGILGTDAIRELRTNGDDSHVIFLTSSVDHAVDAFAVHADNYLLKPYTYEQFETVVTPVINEILKAHAAYLPLKTRQGLRRINFGDIVYSETSGHEQAVHVAGGEVVASRMSSQALFDHLSGDSRFFKAGSSYIINLNAVIGVEGGDVTMNSGDVSQVPVRLRRAVADAFFERSFDAAF